MKKVTITANDGKRYTLMFNRKTAAVYNDMGYTAKDLRERPLVAVPVFIWCAFKAAHPSIKQSKTEEVWDELSAKSKSSVMTALVDMYTDTYTSLMGDENGGDDEGNSAAVEFEE
ncbi:MAG: DUF5055 domain-containing protein [Lachnospiraceae bacterium]|nr:DUF5055 domain-containing protein [Ruminococcus sp.]MCM1277062.1 DUF5055 domain-containing protein [Lachnospiraceae bacterium]